MCLSCNFLLFQKKICYVYLYYNITFIFVNTVLKKNARTLKKNVNHWRFLRDKKHSEYGYFPLKYKNLYKKSRIKSAGKFPRFRTFSDFSGFRFCFSDSFRHDLIRQISTCLFSTDFDLP